MKKVAVVEDNPDNRMLVEALLEDDYELTMYQAGPEALVGMVAAPPHVLLLDISLPGMDGVEVLAALRKLEAFAGLPVIALTAHAMSSDREKYLGLGFDEYVTKPIVDEDILIAAIERLTVDVA